MAPLAAAPTHVTSGVSYAPEDSPFSVVVADVTHRCNMACRNCYIPNREVPDMDADWLEAVLRRLPRRVDVRILGAEPTVRPDLPDLVRRVRRAGHRPVLLTNGLRLAHRDYVRELKRAGLRTVYLSMNGGLRDELYAAVDDLACGPAKLAAFESLCAEHMHLSVGMIVVPGVNEDHLAEFAAAVAARREVRELKLRAVAPIGRHLEGARLSFSDLATRAERALGLAPGHVEAHRTAPRYAAFRWGRIRVQLLVWPDLGSRERGRLTPDGRVEPFFEHLLANEGGY